MDATRLIVGTGYLGVRVAQLWCVRGVRCFGTTRHPSRFLDIEATGAEPSEWDVLHSEGTLPAAEVVVYSVGFDASSGADRRDVTVEGLRRTLDRLAMPRLFIYISTTGVYGECQGEWVDESSPVQPIDAAGQAYLEAEGLLWDWSSRHGWATIVLRLAGIYGPGRLINRKRLRAREPLPADPETWLNLIHVEDAARVVEAARVHGNSGETYLVSDGHPVKRRDFYREMACAIAAPEPAFEPEAASRRRGDRKINNRKMVEDLRVELRYPNYQAGLASLPRFPL